MHTVTPDVTYFMDRTAQRRRGRFILRPMLPGSRVLQGVGIVTHRAGRVLVCLAVVLTVVGADAVRAQSAVSVVEADAIRDTLTRPSSEHGLVIGDVVASPVRLAALPLDLTLVGISELVGFLAVPDRYSVLIDAYRDLEEVGIRPNVVTNTGMRGGLALSVDWTFVPRIVAETELSVRGYQRYRVSWSSGSTGGTANGRRPGPTVDADAEFSRLTREPFWGVGIDAPFTDRTDFLQDIWRVGVAGRRALLQGVTVSVAGGWERRSVGRGRETSTPDLVDVFDEGTLPGLEGPSRFATLTVSVAMDGLRPPDSDQPSGIRGRTTWSFHRGVGGTDVDFGLARGSATTYLPVSSHQYVSLRAGLEAITGGGERVPFVYLPSLGGSSLRSYETGRFRDRVALFGGLGWHWELWRDLREQARLEAFLFVDQGSTGPEISGLSDPRSSWGFGLGGRWLDRVRANVHVAFGAEGTRWLGELSTEAF